MTSVFYCPINKVNTVLFSSTGVYDQVHHFCTNQEGLPVSSDAFSAATFTSKSIFNH